MPLHDGHRTPTKKTSTAKTSSPAKKAPAKKAAPAAAPTSKKENSVSKDLGVGSPVLVQVDPRQNNGSDVALGFVTKVHDGDEQSVNVRVFTDGPDVLWLTSVGVVKSQPKAEDKEQGEDETASEAKVRNRVCWPA